MTPNAIHQTVSTLWKKNKASFHTMENRRSRVLHIALTTLLLAAAYCAAMPQPMVIYYGQALNEYGTPYAKGAADVILRIGTNDVARHAIVGSYAPGVNFVLRVPVDAGINTRPYVDYAAKVGDTVTILIADKHGERVVIENAVIPDVSNPGDLYPIRVTAGTDLDGDGLPDEWELELIARLGDPGITTIYDVRPNDDADGDGATNLEEYIAGTVPYLGYDVFAAEDMEWASDGSLLTIRVLSAYGRVYQVMSAPTTLVGQSYDWAPCPYATAANGEATIHLTEGTGNWITFYIEPTVESQVFHLSVK